MVVLTTTAVLLIRSSYGIMTMRKVTTENWKPQFLLLSPFAYQMHFQMWIQSIVGCVSNAKSISTSTLLVLMITLDLVCTVTKATAATSDRYINGAVTIANHTTNAITSKSTTTGPTALNPIQSTSSIKVLSRRKRFIAFPEGSSFSVAFCATVGMIGNPELDYMSWALNWGLAYDLPNHTWIIEHRHEKFPKPLVQRRHRRDLYNRLEIAMDNMGYNGRQCILRALCESGQYFFGRASNMVEELIRIVFTLPDTRVLSFEHNDLHEYDNAHRMGKNNVYCSSAFLDCSISLIELALGQYAKPLNFM